MSESWKIIRVISCVLLGTIEFEFWGLCLGGNLKICGGRFSEASGHTFRAHWAESGIGQQTEDNESCGIISLSRA